MSRHTYNIYATKDGVRYNSHLGTTSWTAAVRAAKVKWPKAQGYTDHMAVRKS